MELVNSSRWLSGFIIVESRDYLQHLLFKLVALILLLSPPLEEILRLILSVRVLIGRRDLKIYSTSMISQAALVP